MRCDAVKQRLASLSAGNLPADERRIVQAHLADCPACHAEMVRLDPVAGVLAGMQTPPLPAGFAARVMAAAQQLHDADAVSARGPMRRWRLTSLPVRAAAAVAAFAIGAWGAAELSPAPANEASTRDPRPAEEIVLSDWFEAAPVESLASRYLEAIHPNTGREG